MMRLPRVAQTAPGKVAEARGWAQASREWHNAKYPEARVQTCIERYGTVGKFYGTVDSPDVETMDRVTMPFRSDEAYRTRTAQAISLFKSPIQDMILASLSLDE